MMSMDETKDVVKDAWFGAASVVEEALKRVDASKHPENGSYLIRGPNPFFGIGGDETLVPVETEVQVKGEWVKLVSLLPQGVRVAVIGG